jgi:phage portal protein BeeE
MVFGGLGYPLGLNQTIQGNVEEIGSDFESLVQYAYKQNAVVFACEQVRVRLFSEARFQFRRLKDGRPGDLFGNPDLAILETPWPNGTTGDLLARMIQDADFGGNFFGYRSFGQIHRMRPDWVDIILGSKRADAQVGDLDIEAVGYRYYPGGRRSGRDPVILLREQVAHFAPVPDPLASFRGMSWLTPVIREIMADGAATDHKNNFWNNGATPNMIVKFDTSDLAEFQQLVDKFKEGHEGRGNEYKTFFAAAGTDAEVVGRDFQQMDFRAVQGAGETRIAADAGVPPVIVGLSEGLAAATYSNYGQARRALSDGTLHPLWRNAAGSLAPIVKVPGGAELWFDTHGIPFLQDDMKDKAEIQSSQAAAIKQLVDAGYEADSVVKAILADDLSLLAHSGLFSVQLQPAGSVNNGTGNGQVELPVATPPPK